MDRQCDRSQLSTEGSAYVRSQSEPSATGALINSKYPSIQNHGQEQLIAMSTQAELQSSVRESPRESSIQHSSSNQANYTNLVEMMDDTDDSKLEV